MTRKPRSDSKLHSLPPEHRAKVDRWLFDKSLSYQQVADACRETFGLKLSRSSVARYFDRQTQARLAEQRRAAFDAEHAQETAALLALTPDQRYHWLITRIGELANYLMDGPIEEVDHQSICLLVKVLIAYRRERLMADRVALERQKFEHWAAEKVLKHLEGAGLHPGSTRIPQVRVGVSPTRSGVSIVSAARRKPTPLEWDLAERNGFNTLYVPPP